jgi:ATP-dependent RNA helicase DeaD
MSPEIMSITHQYQKTPKLVKVVKSTLTVPQIKQYCYNVPHGKQMETLTRLLDCNNPARSIIFCNTKRMVEELVNELQFQGYSADGLHGDIKQQTRSRVMNNFKKGRVGILVATDVAARGIDVDDVDAVFNFDVPQDEEYYVHRIGRTGRAGKRGTAYTLIRGRRQQNMLKDIQRYTKTDIELKPIPSIREVEGIRKRQLAQQIADIIKTEEIDQYKPVVEKLMEKNYSAVEIACALLHKQSGGKTAEIIGDADHDKGEKSWKSKPKHRQGSSKRKANDRRGKDDKRKRKHTKHNT